MNKKPRVYALYRTAVGITCLTRCYDGILYHVGATSIKQAYYLAGNDQWGYPIGILEKYERNANPTTRHFSGAADWATWFKHGQRLWGILLVIRKHGEVKHVSMVRD